MSKATTERTFHYDIVSRSSGQTTSSGDIEAMNAHDAAQKVAGLHGLTGLYESGTGRWNYTHGEIRLTPGE